MTARILVTGAGGFVGRAVVARLARDGRDVVAAGRTRPEAPPGVDALSTGDLRSADLARLVAGIDCVVHCAARAHVLREEAADPLAAFRAVNRDATIALARAAAHAGTHRFVFLSSIGVNGGETHGIPFTPKDLPQPHSPYAVAKREAEQALAEIAHDTRLEVVVIRPPLVIGPGAKGNLGTLAGAVARGVPLPLGAITANRRDLVSLDALVELVVLAIDHPAAPGAPLLAGDGVPRSTRGIVEEIAQLVGRPARLLPIPPALLGATLRALGRGSLAGQLLGDLEVDISATTARLGWRPGRPR